MDFYIMESGFFQKGFQVSILVDFHAADDFYPLIILIAVAVTFIADKECAARAEHSADFAEALGQVRPEVDGFEGCCRIEAGIFKFYVRHAALNHGAQRATGLWQRFIIAAIIFPP